MPKLKSDARHWSAPVLRVKAESRVSGSAPALALTRKTGADILKAGKKRSTSNTVAEEALQAPSRRTRGGPGCFDTNAVAFALRCLP